jgi:hypothetical protein
LATSRSISVRLRLTRVPSFSNGSISCRMPPTSSGVASRRLFQLLVHHHGADAVVHVDLQQQRAVDGKRNDVAALHARLAGLDAVLQVEGGVGGALPGRARASSCSASASGSSVSMGLSSLSGSSGRTRMPAISVTKISLSACRAMATDVATSSIVRLKASPVGEKPNGDSSTSAPMSSVRVMPATSTLRTRPECWKSTPSTMPTGRAVRKLP